MTGGCGCRSWWPRASRRWPGCSSSDPASRVAAPATPPRAGGARRELARTRRHGSLPGIGRLVLLGFLAVLAFAAFEGTFALFLRRRMDWDARTAAFAFAGIGSLERAGAGGPDPPARPPLWRAAADRGRACHRGRWFAGLAIADSAPELAGSMTAGGSRPGPAQPVRLGPALADHSDSEQGAVFGTLSSAQTLARMISYSTSNVLLGQVSTAAPYWSGFRRRRRRPGWRRCGSWRDLARSSRTKPAGRSGSIATRCRSLSMTRSDELPSPIAADPGKVAIEIAADRLRVGVAVASHDLDDLVAVGDSGSGWPRPGPVDARSSNLFDEVMAGLHALGVWLGGHQSDQPSRRSASLSWRRPAAMYRAACEQPSGSERDQSRIVLVRTPSRWTLSGRRPRGGRARGRSRGPRPGRGRVGRTAVGGIEQDLQAQARETATGSATDATRSPSSWRGSLRVPGTHREQEPREGRRLESWVRSQTYGNSTSVCLSTSEPSLMSPRKRPSVCSS